MGRKKKIIIILISIVVIIGALLIFYNIQNKSSQPPTISISEEEWDFGRIKEDESPVHIFTIKNIGREELIISRVRASCGCTATMLSSDNIQPGKSAELKVTFNPVGISFNLANDSEGETIGRFILENSGEEGIKFTSIKTPADYLIPLVSEIDLNSVEKENL